MAIVRGLLPATIAGPRHRRAAHALVALNAQRAAEEKTGKIRWLRPEFQNPQVLQNKEHSATVQSGLQAEMALETDQKPVSDANTSPATAPWPATLPEQVRSVAQLLASHAGALSLAEIGQGEYVSMFNKTIHTNTIEGFFSVFKRGMKGVYQRCGHNHLNRYLAEFDFRYNNRVANGVDDSQRAVNLLLGVKGKHLIYQTTH